MMTISNEAVEAVARVLVAHQRQNAGSCLCGWARLGYSHPEHQAALVMEATAPIMQADAGAKALEDAAEEFESHIGVGEFAEQSIRDGAYWLHIQEAWDQQGPYMDWLRNRAEIIRSTNAHD